MPRTLRFVPPLLAAMLSHTALAAPGGPGIEFEVTSRITAYDGRTFGEHGAYERIKAVAHMRIDPNDPANQGIVDLSLAPRDAEGLVRYDVDVVILRPKEVAQARRVMLYEVVNRGIKLLSAMNNGRPGLSADPIDAGDGFLMRQGYTLVWSGWQGDISTPGMVGARFPTVGGGGNAPVTGPAVAEMVFDNAASNRITLSYPAANLDQSMARLTVAQKTGDAPIVLPAGTWRFENDRRVTITRPEGMDAGAIYRFEYVARDSRVMGLGFAATRDLIAWLRQAPAAAGNPLADMAEAPCERDAQRRCTNPQGGHYSSAVAIGGSQSGRYLRDFVWQGFNRDLSGKRVFDGVIPYIPGGRRTFTNFRFAEPGRFSRQHEDHGVSGFDFPFTYGTLNDPVTGKRDGILRACTETATCPKVFHIDTSAEFWQAGASLIGTGATGRDVPLPANVRAYLIAGGAHAPGMVLTSCAYPANSFNYYPVFRALLPAMVDWTAGRSPPPQSRWPSLARGELVPLDRLQAPAVPALGGKWARVMNEPLLPPGKSGWQGYVPRVDADGNDLAGIHLPQIAVPDGTYLGWNLRKAGYGEGDLCLLAGTFVPFAKDASTRAGDPRRSMAERYPRAGDRSARMKAAADALVRNRFLLREDADRIVEQAGN